MVAAENALVAALVARLTAPAAALSAEEWELGLKALTVLTRGHAANTAAARAVGPAVAARQAWVAALPAADRDAHEDEDAAARALLAAVA